MPVGIHNIKLLTLAEIEQIGGYVGNFKVRVASSARASCARRTAPPAATAPRSAPRRRRTSSRSAWRRARRSTRRSRRPSRRRTSSTRRPASATTRWSAASASRPARSSASTSTCRRQVHDFEVGTIVVATGMDVFDPTGDGGVRLRPLPERRHEPGVRAADQRRRPDARRGRAPRRPQGAAVASAFIQCVGSRST